MSERILRLKHPTGWFAAGREVSRALPLLSDGAFRLYLHLCITAERSTGQVQADHADLAKALGKSRRSMVVYLEELQRQGVCKTRPARNQHGRVRSRSAMPFGLTKGQPLRRSRKAWRTTRHISAVCWRAGRV